ncbi:MAG: hypothetical protein MJ051_03310 [Akkermansia sp.]|nr:hypothetical protein [Akkermansia sp.]
MNLTPLTASEKHTLFTLCRHAVYIGIQLLVVFALWGMGSAFKEGLIEEYGVLENLQSGVLLLTSVILLGEAARHERYRAILFSLAMCTTAALIREQDAFLDEHLPIISWKFCFIFPIMGLAALWRQIRTDRAPLFDFFRSGSFGIMLMAFVTIVPLAQCLGHRHFVIDVLGTEEDPRLIRRFLEEPFELMGYIQILLAAIEFYFDLLRKRSRD